jgi:prolyl 4-hydroxylase
MVMATGLTRFTVLLVLASTSCSSAGHLRAGLAFAGGFGQTKGTQGRNKGDKRKSKGLSEVERPVKKADEGPKLDKWGLPLPTEEDLFPPMPPGTVLIPAPENGSDVTRAVIEDAIKEHIPLDLKKFGEDKVELDPPPGKPPMKLNLLHLDPPVLSIENFFTESECREAKAVTESASGDERKDAMQIDSATFSALAMSRRTSTSWFCYYAQLPNLLAKAHHVLGIPMEQFEEPQIVRYRTGEEFSWHYDEVPPTQLDNGGQRLATLLVYLNDVSLGGGTIFRDLKDHTGSELTMKPRKGSALLFFPAFADGRTDDRTLHKGEVAEDTKWICQMWIHQRKYYPVVPPGNSLEAAIPHVKAISRALQYTC